MVATGGYDTKVRLYDAAQRTLVRTVQFFDQQVVRLAFSGSGAVSSQSPLLLIVAGSTSVAVYDVSARQVTPKVLSVYHGHLDTVTAVGFEPKHSAFVFSASEDGTLHTWLPEMPPEARSPYPNLHRRQFVQPPFPAISRNFSVPTKFINCKPDGTMVAIHDAVYYPPLDLFFTADYLGRMRIWDHRTRSLKSEHIPHPSKRNLQCIDLSADFSKIALANFDGILFIYNAHQLVHQNPNTHIKPLTIRANNAYIPRVKFNRAASLLVCTTKCGAIKVFRMADILSQTTANPDSSPQSPTNPDFSPREPSSPDFSPKAFANLDLSSRTPDAIHRKGKERMLPFRDFTGRSGWIWDATFIEDHEQFLITCSSTTQLMFWDLFNMQFSNEFTSITKVVTCLAAREVFSPPAKTVPRRSSSANQSVRNSATGAVASPQNLFFPQPTRRDR